MWKAFYVFRLVTYFLKHKDILNIFSKNYKISNQNENPGVYKIFFDDCFQVYIEQTGRMLCKQVNEHKYAVRTDHYSALTNHS